MDYPDYRSMVRITNIEDTKTVKKRLMESIEEGFRAMTGKPSSTANPPVDLYSEPDQLLTYDEMPYEKFAFDMNSVGILIAPKAPPEVQPEDDEAYKSNPLFGAF